VLEKRNFKEERLLRIEKTLQKCGRGFQAFKENYLEANKGSAQKIVRA